ncbi:hypothetical protein [Terriglobus saanensis]|uniref:Uncharacterized protein n=1 Tax=Terriglobus saanensis (strain ATCC BAA-1853 / DSM 23119 / SP1PR4) TaxID=401053 RepID=E8V7F9_TERSS|nr:hypothetical protein [Terriglobus saanensis]ADV83933.1 hypothetical protein AciPR4_3177 [Terriglobus saanensis SP1PR4]
MRFVVFLLLLSGVAWGQEHAPRWAKAARIFDLQCEHHCESAEVRSPDGQYSVGFDYSSGESARIVVLHGAEWVADLDLSAWQQGEIQWSPGSRAFSIMGDEGEHPPAVRVWVLAKAGVREVDLHRMAGVAAGWKDARTLVVETDPGAGVEVDVLREKVRRVAAKEFAERWRDRLGIPVRR